MADNRHLMLSLVDMKAGILFSLYLDFIDEKKGLRSLNEGSIKVLKAEPILWP